MSLSAASVLLQSLGVGKLSRQLSGALLVLFGVWMMLPFLGGPAVLAHHAQHMAP